MLLTECLNRRNWKAIIYTNPTLKPIIFVTVIVLLWYNNALLIDLGDTLAQSVYIFKNGMNYIIPFNLWTG